MDTWVTFPHLTFVNNAAANIKVSVSRSVLPDGSLQTPLSMEFFRQEY